MAARALTFETIGASVEALDATSVEGVFTIVLRIDPNMSGQDLEWLVESWRSLTQGTPLEGVRTAIIRNDVDIQLPKL